MSANTENIYKRARTTAGLTQPLAQAVVQLLHRIREFDEQHRVRELLSIAEDGQIDSAEREDFDGIIKELDGIVQAAMALKFSEGGSK